MPDRDTVYLTLGTIWNTRTDVFRIVLEALRDDLNVVVTVGRTQQPDALVINLPLGQGAKLRALRVIDLANICAIVAQM